MGEGEGREDDGDMTGRLKRQQEAACRAGPVRARVFSKWLPNHSFVGGRPQQPSSTEECVFESQRRRVAVAAPTQRRRCPPASPWSAIWNQRQYSSCAASLLGVPAAAPAWGDGPPSCCCRWAGGAAWPGAAAGGGVNTAPMLEPIGEKNCCSPRLLAYAMAPGALSGSRFSLPRGR